MTAKPVRLRPSAAGDVNHAADYYVDAAGPSVAHELVVALQNEYRPIGLNPGLGSPRFGYELDIPGLRGRALDRFPYTILYFERVDHIDVVRVLHQRRDIPELLQDLDQN